MGFSVIATAAPTAIPGLYDNLWGIQHVSPRGRVKIKRAFDEPQPGDPATILKPLGYAEFRVAAPGTLDEVPAYRLWIWALDDPVELWVESPYVLRLR